MATDSMCLENLDEFIFDENRVVTCKWLSLTLKIHINQAKQLLYAFLQQQKAKHKDVNATYFLAGVVKGDNGTVEHRFVVVAEEDLDHARSQFSTVTSCHVYSIQRTRLKDSGVLYMTNYEGVKENLTECNKYSSIQCKKAAVPRPVPVSVQVSHQTSHSADQGKGRDTQNQNEKPRAEKATTPAAVFGGGSGSNNKGKKAEPKGSIASMFAQSSTKSSTDDGSKRPDIKKEDTKENKPAAKKGSVMAMFANAKPAEKKNVAALEKIQEKQDTRPPQVKNKSPVEVAPTVKKETKVEDESKGKRKSRKGADSDSEDLPEKKKRRRIKNDLFDSSSDEETEMALEESPIPSPVREATPEPESPIQDRKKSEAEASERIVHRKTPETERVMPNNGAGGSTNGSKRRRRKLVPKTYLDDDGFMVTEKVWESESASEVEEEPAKNAAVAPQKKVDLPAKKSQQKKSSPVKGKQTVLMSFFKKK